MKDELERRIGELENLRQKHEEYECYEEARECTEELDKLRDQLEMVIYDSL